MGIRFACHACNHKLNVKSDLAGRRGICPACSGRFRIPMHDAEQSMPVEERNSSAVPGDDPATASASAGPPSPQITTRPAGHHETGHDEQGHDAAVHDEPGHDAANIDTTSSGQRPAVDSDSNVAPLAANPVPSAVPSSETILDQDDDGTWYVRPPSGGQYGPATTELLKQWIEEGRIAATSLLWRDGWPQWRTASEALPELISSLPNPELNATAPTAGGADAPAQAAGPTLAAGQPSAPAATNPAAPTPLSGDAEIGTNRRKRSNQRLYLIGILVALVALLVAGLLYALNR